MIKALLFKQRKFWIVTIFALILSLPCVYFLMKPNQTYIYEGKEIFASGELLSETVIFEQVSLQKGVYIVELSYDVDTFMHYICNVSDGSVLSGALLSNGEHLNVGLGKTSFQMWLYEDTEDLEVFLSGNGEGYVQTGKLTFYETNQLWTMMLIVIWSVVFLLYLMIFFINYDRCIGIEKEQKTVVFLLSIVILIASIPSLLGGSFFGADLGYHIHRIEGVKDGLLSGQFPVRLESKWLFGYGYADGIMYCNALLYVPAILRICGFTVVGAYNVYAVMINTMTVVIAYYSFRRIFRHRYIGVICSGLYTMSIFRMYKFVISAAMGEGSAFTFFPLILYGFYRVFAENPEEKKYKTAWIPLTLGFAGTLQTHVLSCEITAFITILVLLIFVKKIFHKNTFLVLLKGAGGAVLLSLWYLVPFLDYYLNEDLHIKHVSARTIQDRGLYFPQLFFHFWKSGGNALLGEEGMRYSNPMGVGFVLGLGFIAFGVMWGNRYLRKCSKSNKNERNIQTLGKVSFVLGGMLMIMSLNIFPWDMLQNLHPIAASLVSSIQFPNRFLGWATAFLVTLFGCCLSEFRCCGDKWKFYTGVICALIGITTSSMYLQDYVGRDNTLLDIHNIEGIGFGYISGAEYLIEGTDAELLGYNAYVNSSEIEVDYYEKGNLSVNMLCSNTSNEVGYIDLPLLLYKGYRAWDLDSGEEFSLTYGDNFGIRLWIPEGYAGEIVVRFVSFIYWRIAEVISVISYIVIIILGLLRLKKYVQAKEKLYAKVT